jgi:hypothetical protein
MQYFDLFLPQNDDNMQQPSHVGNNGSSEIKKDCKVAVRGTLFFVHGGAWGSGHPWMYRLVAASFLQRNFAVAIVGYRTYPDASNIDDQVDDIRLAFDELDTVLNECVVPVVDDDAIDGKERDDDDDDDNGWVGNIIMGHSSGAHIALLLLVDMISERMKPSSQSSSSVSNRYPWSLPDYFIGLSGPYDISNHFDFEAGRGVEQISPMKPICGHSRATFDRASPAKRLMSRLASFCEYDGGGGVDATVANSIYSTRVYTLQQITPSMLFVHGIEDATVPFTATSDVARVLRSCGLQCHEIYLERTSHQDVIMHFMMMGGAAMDAVFGWIFGQKSQDYSRKIKLQSRL